MAYISDIVVAARTGTDPYQNLANAIVIVAAQDYRKALSGILEPALTYDDFTKHVLCKDECEEFFRSYWCKMLTKANVGLIMTEILDDAFSDIPNRKTLINDILFFAEETKERIAVARRNKSNNKKVVGQKIEKLERVLAATNKLLVDLEE